MTLEQQQSTAQNLQALKALRRIIFPLQPWMKFGHSLFFEVPIRLSGTHLQWVGEVLLPDGEHVIIARNRFSGHYVFGLSFEVTGETFQPLWRPEAAFTNARQYAAALLAKLPNRLCDPSRDPAVLLPRRAKQLAGTRRHPRFVPASA